MTPDEVMLRRRPNANRLFPEPRVPEGALEPRRPELPPVLPYARFGTGIYGRHHAGEIGLKGEF